MIIASEFNIDWSKEGTYKKRLKYTFNDNGFKQIVNEYTTASTKTILEYVIANNTNISENNNISNKQTDH